MSPVSLPIPTVLVGAGHRARAVWGPLLRGHLADRVSLLGVVGRGRDRGQATADALGVPLWPDLDAGVTAGVRLAIVCVSAHENAPVAHAVLNRGWSALLETPLALSAADATALAARIATHAAPVGVAEQNVFHLEQRLLIALARSGVLGEPRGVVSDGAGYLYHAAAVAHAALGDPAPRAVSAQRVELPGLDVGRGGPEFVLTGTVRYAGGALFTLRDAEAAWREGGPFGRGGYRVMGSGGEAAGRSVIVAHGAGWRPAPVEERRASDGRLIALSCAGVTVEVARPQHALSDDAQAAAACLLRLLEVHDGVGRDGSARARWNSNGQGSRDGSVLAAQRDVLVLDAMQRSARLGGALIAV